MMTAKKAKPKLAPSDPSLPVFEFETPKWRQGMADALLSLGRAARTGDLKAVELLAHLQVTVNALSEKLDMTALEDKENLTTIVLKTPRVVPSDPSYR